MWCFWFYPGDDMYVNQVMFGYIYVYVNQKFPKYQFPNLRLK